MLYYYISYVYQLNLKKTCNTFLFFLIILIINRLIFSKLINQFPNLPFCTTKNLLKLHYIQIVSEIKYSIFYKIH